MTSAIVPTVSGDVVSVKTATAWPEIVFVYAMIGSTLTQICIEIVGLQRTEAAEVEEPFHRRKSSGTMPHKRNPLMSEGVVALNKLIHAQVSPALGG